MITFLIFIGTILVLVGVHEGGHFLAARLSGVYVKEFSIGFGPRLFSLTGQETRYSFRIIPFGGYVRMAGEDREERSSDIPAKRLLYNKIPMVRIMISIAGPAANLFTTLLILVVALWAFGVPSVQVGDLIPGKPAEAVLLPGDRLILIGGTAVYTIDDLDRVVQGSKGEPLEILIERDQKRQSVVIRPRFEPEEGRYLLGIYPTPITYTNTLSDLEPSSPLFAAGLRAGDTIVTVAGTAVEAGIGIITRIHDLLPTDSITLEIVREDQQIPVTVLTAGLDLNQTLAGVTFTNLGITYRRPGFSRGLALGAGQFADYIRLIARWIRGVVAGQIAPSESIAGPIGIARMLGDWAKQGLNVFLQLFSYLSLSLGLLNLIPFPALDGSRAAFALYELVRGTPIPAQREGMIHAIGFLILIAVLVLVTYQDILKLFQ